MHKSELPAQNPVSKKLISILMACAFLLIIVGVITLYLWSSVTEKPIITTQITWAHVHIPMGAKFRITPSGCVKERVLVRGLPWGDTWKEFTDCPGKNIAPGNIGPDLFFQSATDNPVAVDVKYSFPNRKTQVQKIIAPPGQ